MSPYESLMQGNARKQETQCQAQPSKYKPCTNSPSKDTRGSNISINSNRQGENGSRGRRPPHPCPPPARRKEQWWQAAAQPTLVQVEPHEQQCSRVKVQGRSGPHHLWQGRVAGKGRQGSWQGQAVVGRCAMAAMAEQGTNPTAAAAAAAAASPRHLVLPTEGPQ